MDDGLLEEEIVDLTEGVSVCAIRVLLDTCSVRATIPMLRGVWGCAMRDLDMSVYKNVFEGCQSSQTPALGRSALPLYVMRPAPPDPDFSPAVEMLLLGSASEHVSVALEALERAGKAGLGPQRKPFRIRKACGILPDGRQVPDPVTWSASNAALRLLRGEPKSDGLRLEFDAPLRLLRRGKLISEPTFADMAISGLRRLCAFSSTVFRPDVSVRVLDAAKRLPSSGWFGTRQDLVRWSGRQKSQVEMRGVTGWLELPEGAGPFRPLLAAGEWIHLGKGTVFGLGNLKLRNLEAQ